MPRRFHIAAILQLFTNTTLTNYQEVLDIVAYMCPLQKFTLTKSLIKRCNKDIENQLPWIKEINVEGINNDNHDSRMKEIINKYGEYHEIFSTMTVEELRFKKRELTANGPLILNGLFLAYWDGSWHHAREGVVREFPWGDDKIFLTNIPIQ